MVLVFEAVVDRVTIAEDGWVMRLVPPPDGYTQGAPLAEPIMLGFGTMRGQGMPEHAHIDVEIARTWTVGSRVNIMLAEPKVSV